MRINHNVPAIVTQGALSANNRALNKDLEKMSTGLRINRAGDDAAGLAVSEGLRSQIRGVEQAKKNALDGISALNIAEGAMNEIHNILQRQRELAIQSSTGTYRNADREYINQEFAALNSEITRIISATNFNQLKLLTGNAADSNSFVGNALHIDANSTLDVDTIDANYSVSGLSADGSLETVNNASTAIGLLDDAIRHTSSARADIGALVNRLEYTVNNLTVSAANQTAAESQLRDVDFAFQSTQFTKNQILMQSATAMLSQGNTAPQGVLALLR
jgi:flagellin